MVYIACLFHFKGKMFKLLEPKVQTWILWKLWGRKSRYHSPVRKHAWSKSLIERKGESWPYCALEKRTSIKTIILETCLTYENIFWEQESVGKCRIPQRFLGKQKHEKPSLAMESINMPIFCNFQGINRQKAVKRGEFCS